MRRVLPFLLLSACTGSASARLELRNDTPSARTQSLLEDGTSLRMKMIAVYLSEDIDQDRHDNIGMTSMIWMNDECGGDINGCNVDAYATPAGGPRVTTFFDLARSSAEVNAEVNGQDLPIEPGTYRYARIEMCKAGPGEEPSLPTVMWRAPGMDHEASFASTGCARDSVPFDPPLEIGPDDAVSVSLGYDLHASIVVGAPASCGIAGYSRCFRACEDLADGTRACMDVPDFAPTASIDAPL
jgi:hypothetical protein